MKSYPPVSTPVTPSASTNSFVHRQLIASNDWLITHSLAKYPSVTTVDSTGAEVKGNVSYIDTSALRVVFLAPFSGEAYLN